MSSFGIVSRLLADVVDVVAVAVVVLRSRRLLIEEPELAT